MSVIVAPIARRRASGCLMGTPSLLCTGCFTPPVRPTALVPFAVAAVLAAPPLVLAYRDGPLPAMTGGFGEDTCAKCHFDHALNDPGGSLKIDGVPERVEPGHEYAITIAVTHAATKRAGFELSARHADGPDVGTQAGTFRAPDARTRVVSAPAAPFRTFSTRSSDRISPVQMRAGGRLTDCAVPLGRPHHLSRRRQCGQRR